MSRDNKSQKSSRSAADLGEEELLNLIKDHATSTVKNYMAEVGGVEQRLVKVEK